MREELLHFIWRYRYFNHQHLFTESGEVLQVLFPGEHNHNQGPDFSRARIRIGDTIHEGPVELHVKTSDWFRHGHTADEHYREVVLHVVWENDLAVTSIPRPAAKAITGDQPIADKQQDIGDRPIPTLVLKDRVPKLLLGQYESWMKGGTFVPCEGLFGQVPATVWDGWKQQLLIRRLQERAVFIRQCLEQTRQHWEEITWWLMVRSLGQPVNTSAFEAIGRSLPVHLLIRHRREQTILEALLLGQAGLLGQGRRNRQRAGQQDEQDGHAEVLEREYRFLRAKYQLQPITQPVLFHRMRPAHSPARRLVQLAGLLSGTTGWFTRTLEAATAHELMVQLESAEVSGQPLTRTVPELGEDMRRGMLINAFVPLLYAYGWLRDEPECRRRALRWLEELAPESNSIITGWRRLGIGAENAADSQALLELKKNYCNARRCLDCDIGRALLGKC